MFKLVDDWAHKWWRLWSMRLGLVFSALVGWAATDPGGWQQAVNQLPEAVRPLLGGAAFLAIFWSRMAQQPDGQ